MFFFAGGGERIWLLHLTTHILVPLCFGYQWEKNETNCMVSKENLKTIITSIKCGGGDNFLLVVLKAVSLSKQTPIFKNNHIQNRF